MNYGQMRWREEQPMATFHWDGGEKQTMTCITIHQCSFDGVFVIMAELKVKATLQPCLQ